MIEKIPEIFFYSDKNHAGVPVITVQLRSIEPATTPWPCIVCGGETDLDIRSEEYPYREEGFIVRFDRITNSRCDRCGARSVPREVARQQEMVLQAIRGSFSKTSRFISIEEIQRFFSLPEVLLRG